MLIIRFVAVRAVDADPSRFVALRRSSCVFVDNSFSSLFQASSAPALPGRSSENETKTASESTSIIFNRLRNLFQASLAALACCFLAGGLLPAAPAAQDPNAVFSDPRYRKATELMRTGNYGRAEAVLEAAVKAEPAPDAYGLLGYAREMQNRFAAAAKAYRESLRLDTNHLFARIRLGIVLTKQKRNRESLEVLQPIETGLYRHPEALFHLCLAYLETGDPARAMAAAEKMEAIGPEMALRAAKLFVWKEEFPESLPLLSRLAEASPGSAEANYLLATALFRTDQTERMWPYLEKAHRLDPASAPTLLLYGSGLLAEGRFSQARERLLQAQKLRPRDPRLRFLLGKALIGEGDHAGAIAQLEALVKQDPGKPEVQLLLLSAYRSKGDIQATTRQARQAVRKFPGHLQSQLEAGMDLQTVGEFELAEQALRRAVDLSEGKPADRRKARFNLATVLVKLGRDDQAVPLLKEVVDADPGEVEARVELGDSYLRTGDYQQSLQVLQEAAARDPKNKRAHLLLGKAFTRLGRHEEAGKHFQAFQDLETEPAGGQTTPLAR